MSILTAIRDAGKALPALPLDVLRPLAAEVVAGTSTQAELAASILPVLRMVESLAPGGPAVDAVEALINPLACDILAGILVHHVRRHPAMLTPITTPPAAPPVAGTSRERPDPTHILAADSAIEDFHAPGDVG